MARSSGWFLRRLETRLPMGNDSFDQNPLGESNNLSILPCKFVVTMAPVRANPRPGHANLKETRNA